MATSRDTGTEVCYPDLLSGPPVRQRRLARPAVAWTDPAAFAENQRGRVTPVQAAVLQGRVHAVPALTRFLGVAVLVGLPVLLVVVGLAAIGSDGRGAVVLVLAVLVGALEAVLVSRALRERRRVARALACGRILRTTGAVVWDGTTYAVVGAAGPIRCDPRVQPPLPGRYAFHVLSERGYLLSAAPVADGSARLAIQDALARSLGFDAADVAANRAGRLTPRQQGSGPVEHVEGVAQAYWSTTQGVEDRGVEWRQGYRVAGRAFAVSWQAHNALVNGLRYRVHHVGGVIASVEALEP